MKSFECIVPLRWGDMDAMGHLNNTLYFRLIEEARIQWFLQLGITTAPHGEGPILAHASCDFLKPFTYPAEARILQTVSRIGRASLDHDIVIEKVGEPDVAYAKCKAVIVWMDYQAGRSAPWPEAVRAVLADA
jgi:acyl-CoA thioester hydrolase